MMQSPLRSLRAELGISQEELARRAGVHRSVVAKAEHPEAHAIRYNSAVCILTALNSIRSEYEFPSLAMDQVNWCIRESRLDGMKASQVAKRAGLASSTLYKALSNGCVRRATRDRLLCAVNALRQERGLCDIPPEEFPVRCRLDCLY